MKKYIIKVIGKTFFDVYQIKTDNLFFAKILASNKFFKDYTCEGRNVKLQRISVTGKNI